VVEGDVGLLIKLHIISALRINSRTTNQGVRSSNLFGRTKSKNGLSDIHLTNFSIGATVALASLVALPLKILDHFKLFVRFLSVFIETIESIHMSMTDTELHFARRAIKRKKLFLVLSITSVVVGLCLALFYAWQSATQPGFSPGIHFVLVTLILLMARQNLRQYYYAKILEKLIS